MNGKVLAIVAVAVVVVAAAGAGAFFLLKDKDKEPDADYTLLDSNDNIKVGMTIVTDTDAESMTSHAKYVVNAVANGKVTFSMKSETSGDTVLATFDDFMPTGFMTEFPFDYTDPNEVPQGVTVTPDGNLYTINGSFKQNDPPIVVDFTFDNLKINYNGTAVTAVDGKSVGGRDEETLKRLQAALEADFLAASENSPFNKLIPLAAPSFFDYSILIPCCH